MPNTFRQGEHICAVYDTEPEQLAIAAEYLADGLRAGERVLYGGASVAALARFRVALGACGIDVAAETRRGALVQGTHADLHLANGRFDAERMLRLLNEAVEDALNSGFAGLRTCGDMSWLIHEAPGSEEVMEYEALLNSFFRGLRACGMCLYNRQLLNAHLVDHGLATHSSVILDGRHKVNPFYRPSTGGQRQAL
jgi:hypothetical protein